MVACPRNQIDSGLAYAPGLFHLRRRKKSASTANPARADPACRRAHPPPRRQPRRLASNRQHGFAKFSLDSCVYRHVPRICVSRTCAETTAPIGIGRNACRDPHGKHSSKFWKSRQKSPASPQSTPATRRRLAAAIDIKDLIIEAWATRTGRCNPQTRYVSPGARGNRFRDAAAHSSRNHDSWMFSKTTRWQT